MNFRKIVVSIFVASFVGIMANPEMLAASNSVGVAGINDAGIVKTVLPEVKPDFAGENEILRPVIAPSYQVAFLQEAPASYEPEVMVQEETSSSVAQEVVTYDNIQIAGKTLGIEKVSSTAVDSYDHVNKFGSKFYWGHNTSAVFRGLYDLGAGATFTMTEGGVTKKYKVAEIQVFDKNFETGVLQQNGKGNYMTALTNGRYNGASYDVVLMTCYGESVGGGDATQRFVVLARAI